MTHNEAHEHKWRQSVLWSTIRLCDCGAIDAAGRVIPPGSGQSS